jgi:hypothetical protein
MKPLVKNLLLLLCAALSLIASEPPYPRISNYYNGQFRPGASTETLDQLARYHLIVATFNADASRELAYVKQKNPGVIVLHYISVRGQSPKNPLMKDGYWLMSPKGERVDPWPGRNLPNQTLPEVNEVMVAMAREALQRMPKLDGIFLDSYYRHISHINKGQLDADRDGKVDDRNQLDEAWMTGLVRVARGVRALRPNLIVMANGGAPVDFAYEELNGVLFEDQLFYLEKSGSATRAGKQRTADDMLAAYQKWETVPHQPHVTAFVDGGGEIANPWKFNELSQTEKEKLVEEARHNERRMRFNLCFTLMGGGYAAFDYHTTSRGQLWWFPEWSTKLGRPRGSMQKLESYWNREFDGGTVYVNPFAQPATVKEAGGLALPAFDGKVLPRSKAQP